MGLVPERPVPPPVGHVCPDGVSALLPEHLLYQVGAGYVHHHHGAVLGLPERPVDLAVFHLGADSQYTGRVTHRPRIPESGSLNKQKSTHY